jgi:hypothetical protein
VKSFQGRLATAKEINTSLFFKCLADISGGIYLFVDHFLLFDKIKSIQLKPEYSAKLDFLGNILWMLETVSTLLYQIIDLGELNKTHFKVKKQLSAMEDKFSDEYRNTFILDDKLTVDHFKKSIDIARCIADLPVLVHFLTSDKVVSNTACGFFGTISSSIAVYQKFYK